MFKRLTAIVVVLLLLATAALQPAGARASDGPQGKLFVKQAGPELRLNGKIFRFAGTNNYYLMYKSNFMVDDVLNAAAAQGFRVMRTWGWLDIGNQDGSNSIRGKADGIYFQYWDGTKPAYNDGDDGLKRLDYVVYKAGQVGLKLVIPFTNNWNDFGGMDQYVRWRGGQYHDQFYTDPLIRQWFKNWIAHLLNRTNSYTGVQYKNDPAIMAWELANEPRCLSAGAYPRSSGCTTQTLTTWADEMSTFVKSVDQNHLLGVGDEGFYCIAGASDWTENCGEGVDTLAFAKLDNVDLMSAHLYPDHWGKTTAWGTQWISRHIRDARAIDKPFVLGEFGLLDKSTRNPVYKQWTDAVLNGGGSGALYWILSGKQDDGSLYPDYDGFTVYAHDPVFITLGNFGRSMIASRALSFAPVADNDAAITEFATPIALAPAANDIAYGGASLQPGSIDLDPAAAGQQTSKSAYGGTFAWQSGGTVLFTPDAGFAGKASASYTILDSQGRRSNIAALTVTVTPNPSGALMLYSFETGTEGWASASWQTGAGSTSQSADYASDGAYSLKVDTQGQSGGWFGAALPATADLTGKVRLKYDLKTTGAGTSINAALQLSDSWEWCQGSWGWSDAGTTSTVEIDLNNLGCGSPNLSKLNGLYIWVSGGGAFYIDNVRAE